MQSLGSLRGTIIMFDGPDYVGKTTQIEQAAAALAAANLNVYTTRYNGGTPIGEALRSVMLDGYERPPASDLYIGMAQQHALTKQLNLERQKGSVVLVDRSPLSIIAYQVYGSGLDKARGYQAAGEVMGLHQPDLLICYQASDSALEKRRKLKSHKADYFESKPAEYFERVNAGYEDGIKRYNAKVIDASGDIAKVHEFTMKALEQLASKLQA